MSAKKPLVLCLSDRRHAACPLLPPSKAYDCSALHAAPESVVPLARRLMPDVLLLEAASAQIIPRLSPFADFSPYFPFLFVVPEDLVSVYAAVFPPNRIFSAPTSPEALSPTVHALISAYPAPVRCLNAAVSRFLLSLSIYPKHMGFTYLKDAILILLMCPEAASGATTRLYSLIAFCHQATNRQVEHDIRTALDAAERTDPFSAFLRPFVGASAGPGACRPHISNGAFVALAAEWLRFRSAAETEG